MGGGVLGCVGNVTGVQEVRGEVEKVMHACPASGDKESKV